MNQKEAVIGAIKELGHKVSAADVAAKTGLSLHDSRLCLNKIAQETRATLEVSQQGDIAYKFFPDLDAIYRLVGIKKLAAQVWKVVFEAGFFVLRISFGLLLLASILTIVVVFSVALVFILFGVGAADAADGEMDLGGIDFEFFDWDMLGMFFSWGLLSRQTPTSNPDDEYMGMKIDTPDKGFFNNCFSFLFGDGNPNKSLEEKQWQYIAELIRRNNGVVTAAQVKPYLLKMQTEMRSKLDVMVRFDGAPEVTPSGNVVYSFPSLQVTASGVNALLALPDKLMEQEWKFSRVPTERLHWVFFFAGANLCGAYALNHHLSWFVPLQPYAMQVHLLMLYASFFMFFPVAREILNSAFNSCIEIRNRNRENCVKALGQAEAAFVIDEARQFAVASLNLKAEPLAYTTAEDILPQDTDGLAAQFQLLDPAAIQVKPVAK